MKRREAIRRTTLLMGCAISAPALVSIMSGCQREVGRDWTPAFMDADQADLVTALTETIFPTTDTPGAIEAGVGSYIDLTLKNNTSKENQDLFTEGLAALAQRCQERYRKTFIQISDRDRLEFVTALDQEQYDARQKNSNMKYESRPFFWNFKELATAGYFSSEAVAKNYFRYDPIPGDYDGCMDYDGKAAWADL